MSTALRSVGLLDVLSSTPAEPSGRAPCFHARLRRLATKPGEKCGLAAKQPEKFRSVVCGLYYYGRERGLIVTTCYFVSDLHGHHDRYRKLMGCS